MIMTDFKDNYAQRAKEFLDEVTSDTGGKWNAQGKAGVAKLLGFEQPTDDDDSGTWRHATLGEFHDKQMVDVTSLIIKQHCRAMLGDPDLKTMINHLGNELAVMIIGLERSIGQDYAAGQNLTEHASEIMTLLKLAKRLSDSVL